jgi:hypothetical protein
LCIVETIEEDHAFSSSPRVRSVNVFAAIVCEPGRQESGNYLPWPNKVDAKGKTCVLNDEGCKEHTGILIHVELGQD